MPFYKILMAQRPIQHRHEWDRWTWTAKPGVHIRPDGLIVAKKPKGKNFVVKNFKNMEDAHKFYFGDFE